MAQFFAKKNEINIPS